MKHKVNIVGCLLLNLIIFPSECASNVSDTVNLCDNGDLGDENYSTWTTELCGCDDKLLCVRKCCRKGFVPYHVENHPTGARFCVRNDSNSTNFSVPVYYDVTKQYDLNDGFMIGLLRCENSERYVEINNVSPRQKFFIQNDGTLYYPFEEKIYGSDKYCIDERDGLTAYVCLTTPGSFYYVAAILVSLPFLLTTFLIHVVIPELNLHDKCSMCYVLTLIFGYTSSAIAQHYAAENHGLCQALGFSIIFFMMASFFWMNVICVEIWCTFSNLPGCHREKSMENKILALSFLYAWGIPGLVVGILTLLNTYGDSRAGYYPRIGSPLCFLNGHLPTLLFYFGPILVIIVINIILCILTAISIQKVRRRVFTSRASLGKGKCSKFCQNKLHWKLFFASSINPLINIDVIQTISWVIGWKLSEDTAICISFIKNTVYATYGIFIFVIFGCKTRFWKILKKRYYNFFPKNSADSRPSTIYLMTAKTCVDYT